ncbi:delta-60 repeat domain-containing protein [bacterium]|nr:delta-60 repeat domain-containing protein [bacterium]
MAIQNDGKILVGGHFTSYSGSSANRIIRLNAD